MKKTGVQNVASVINASIHADPYSQIYIENFQTAENINNITQHPSPVANQLPSLWGTMLLKNPYFYTPQVMNNIQDAFNKNDESKLIVLSGLGGTGKTELGKHYFYQSQKPYNAKLWFNASTREHLESEYRLLAMELNLSVENQSADLIKRKIHTFLAEHPGWLLVLDNADNRDDIIDLLPPRGGDILITSRQMHWQGQVITINAMEEQEAIFLYKKLHSAHKDSDETIKQLVNKLGCLPLAIAQSIAYIQQVPNIDASAYLILFERYQKQLLGTNKLSTASDEASRLTIQTTWNLSLDAIENKYSANDMARHYARTLLIACSFLDSKNIPISLLQDFLALTYNTPDIALILNEAIGSLHNYSLIQVNDQAICVHSLLQAAVRFQLTQSKHAEFYKNLLTCLDKAFNYQKYPIVLRTWENIKKENSFYDQYIFHIYAVAKNNLYIAHSPLESHALLLKLVQYLIEIKSNYKLAKKIVALIEEIHLQTSGNQTLLTKIELLREKSSLSQALGNFNQAKIESAEALDLCKNTEASTLESFFIDTLNCQLGNIYYHFGKYIEAERQYHPVIANYKKNTDERCSINLANAWCGIGNIRYAENKLEQAENAFKKSLNIYSITSQKTTHQTIAHIYNTLGQIEHKECHYDAAINYYKNAQEIYQNIHASEHHINIAICHYNMARALFASGKTAEAISKAQRSLNIYIKIYDVAGHIDMIAIVFYLGFLICRNGNSHDGIKKYHRALTTYDSTLKDDHDPPAYRNLKKYAEKYFEKKEYGKAEECYLLLMQQRYPDLKNAGTHIIIIKEDERSDNRRNLDSKVQSELISACSNGDVNRAMTLASSMNVDLNAYDERGITPLEAASKHGHLNIVKLLLTFRNVEIGTRNSPILMACSNDNFEVVDYFLNIKTNNVNNQHPPGVWETKYKMMLNCGSASVSQIKKSLPQIIDCFFSNDTQIKDSAAKTMIAFEEKLLPALYALHHKDSGTVLRAPPLEEIILTICTMDIEATYSLLKNLTSSGYDRYHEEALYFLKKLGINQEILMALKKEKVLTKDIEEHIYTIMQRSFMFCQANSGKEEITSTYVRNQTPSSYQYNFQSHFFNNNRLSNTTMTTNSQAILNTHSAGIAELSLLASKPGLNAEDIEIIITYLMHDSALLRLATQNLIIKFKLHKHPSIFQALEKACKNTNWRIRNEAIKFLERTGALNAATQILITNALQDPEPNVSLTAISILAKQNTFTQEIMVILNNNLSNSNWKIRYGSIKVLMKKPLFDTIFIDGLIHCTMDEDEDVRALATQLLKKTLNTHHELIFKSIIKNVFNLRSNNISTEAVDMLLLLIENRKADENMAATLIKWTVHHGDNYHYYDGKKRILEMLIKRYKDNKKLFNSLITDSGQISTSAFAIIIKIFPSFKDTLFEKTLGIQDTFTKNVFNVDILENILKIFPEQQDRILLSFKQYCLNINALYMYDVQGLVDLARLFPDIKNDLFSKTIQDPVWFLSSSITPYGLQSIIDEYPEKIDVLFEIIINDKIWISCSITNTYTLCRFASSFPAQKEKIYTLFLDDHLWLLSSVKSINDLKDLTESFPEHHEAIFNKTLGSPEWKSFDLHAPYSIDKQIELSKIFPNQVAILAKNTIQDPAWIKRNITSSKDLCNAAKNFPAQQDLLFTVCIINENAISKYVFDVDNLEALACAFPNRRKDIFDLTIANQAWLLENRKKIIYGVSWLSKIFPDQKSLLCKIITDDPTWIITFAESINTVIMLVEIFHVDKELLLNKFKQEEAWFSAIIAPASNLQRMIKLFPESEEILRTIAKKATPSTSVSGTAVMSNEWNATSQQPSASQGSSSHYHAKYK